MIERYLRYKRNRNKRVIKLRNKSKKTFVTSEKKKLNRFKDYSDI